MRSAFEVVKSCHPRVMDHLSYEEFEDWLPTGSKSAA
jgi:hypothetical protein